MTTRQAIQAALDAIRVQPTVMWRMQRPDGTYCMEWDAFGEREAREYYAQRHKQNPADAAQYQIGRVDVLYSHGKKCNEVADLVTEMFAEFDAELAAAAERERVMREDLLCLQEFADSVFGEFPEHGDIDGCDLQGIAETCGLLKMETVSVPCGELCSCADCGVACGTKTECYRVQPVMSRARRASAQAFAARAALKGSQP